jgi:hypothetical protein
VSEVKYRLLSDVELPARMQGEHSFSAAYEMACEWNDRHPAEQRAFLEKVSDESEGEA